MLNGQSYSDSGRAIARRIDKPTCPVHVYCAITIGRHVRLVATSLLALDNLKNLRLVRISYT